MRRIYIKEEACTGCHLCEIYCQLQHAQSKNIVRALTRERPHPLPRLRVEEKGEISFSVRCQQCEEAPCVQACITGALSRDPVISLIELDQDRCVGCWTCILACPIGAIMQDREQNRALICDLCQGKEMPACVANCPNEALFYIESEDVNTEVQSEMTVPGPMKVAALLTQQN